MNDYAGAISSYNNAITAEPDFYLAYNNRGTIYFQQGKLEEALSDFDQAIKINPKYAPAHSNRGAIMHKQENYKEALAAYDKAIQYDSKHANAYLNRGITKEMLRDESGACIDWSKARKLGLSLGKKYYINNCN